MAVRGERSGFWRWVGFSCSQIRQRRIPAKTSHVTLGSTLTSSCEAVRVSSPDAREQGQKRAGAEKSALHCTAVSSPQGHLWVDSHTETSWMRCFQNTETYTLWDQGLYAHLWTILGAKDLRKSVCKGTRFSEKEEKVCNSHDNTFQNLQATGIRALHFRVDKRFLGG